MFEVDEWNNLVSSNDGKLRRYDFPMNAIVDYVNMEINKYGSD